MSTVALTNFITELEADAPRLYSRWSAQAWRLACEGPALQLWEGLGKVKQREAVLSDYLYLLREAVGLQYLSAASPADLDPRNPHGAGSSFLAVALCDALPRLLPATPAKARAAGMASLWNVGERLASKPAWLNRYLAARLLELDALDGFEPFLRRVLEEGLEDKPPRTAWRGRFTWTTLDLAAFDRGFLPGRMHLATPAIACVHDRRSADRHLAILLRRAEQGGPVCLGSTPCLVDGNPEPFEPKDSALRAAFADPSLPEYFLHLATRGGHLLYSSPLSQRLWIGESGGR